ncbi:hypothetical protein [uncultured Ruminococcus sp.]|uniref:hypothetical protein n=1 Tax=uncultured Ruminococcus sp. TaxID=165186 RepID=UPI0025E16BA9|nr:hypothetical protein [uncultured Ruminococcus sp.]
MVVNYYGILGCECIWDQNGVFLSAPAGVQVQSLQQLGFYTAADGRWYKQLSPQESAYLNSMKNVSVVDLPAQGYNFGMVSGTASDMEESPEDKKRANTLCLISLILGHGLSLFSYILTQIFDMHTYSIFGTAGLIAFILMIYVRVKYPKNKFGKVLMILYIVEIIIAIIVLIAIIAACASCLNDCS